MARRRRRAASGVRTLAAELRAAGRTDLTRQLKRRVRESAKPLAEDAKRALKAAAIRTGGAPARRGRGARRGLRATLARQLTIKQMTGGSIGVTVHFRMSALGPLWNIPNLMEMDRWRHPVFGDRERWVRQRGAQWWKPVVQRHLGRIRNEVREEVELVMGEINR